MSKAKTITFNYEEVAYTLEYNRAAVVALERQGFNLETMEDKPMTYLPMLFAGAFIMHHKYLKPNRIQEIYDKLPKKMELYEKLVEMYMETVDTIIAEPETKEGNVEWGASW